MLLPPIWSRRSFRSLFRGGFSYLFWGKRGTRRVQGLRLFYRLRMEAALLRVGRKLQRIVSDEVRVWIDGVEAFPRLAHLITRARHTIIVRMFIWKDDEIGRRIAALLTAAADRGVTIDITKDLTGDTFELDKDFLSTGQSPDPLWKKFWLHPRITITTVAGLDHTKAFVIDDDILLLGGMNIADEYAFSWHDYVVELRSARFVRQCLTGEVLEPTGDVRLVQNTVDRQEIRPVLLQFLYNARDQILVEQCYLSDPEVIALLAERSREGVRVTVITPESPDVHKLANLRAIAELISAARSDRLQVLLYPGVLHGKLAIVDRRMAFVGSANYTPSSLDDMSELNVLIGRGHLRALLKLRESVWRDIGKSKPLARAPRMFFVSKILASLGL